MRKFLLFIAIILLITGVKFIFDARPIVKKYFAFGQENDATLGIKLIGFLCCVIGFVICLQQRGFAWGWSIAVQMLLRMWVKMSLVK